MRKRKVIVLLSGEIAGGKSTICNGLHEKYGFHVIRTIDILKKIWSERNGGKAVPKKERDFWQRFGKKLDKENDGKWVLDYAQNEINKNDYVLIDSVRISAQIDFFRDSYGDRVEHIHTHASEEYRLSNYTKRRKERTSGTNKRFKEEFRKFSKDGTEKKVKLLKDLANLVVFTEDSKHPPDQIVRAAGYLRLLPPLNQKNVDVIVGGQFGSEGKGQIAAYISPEYDCLVRVGGPNAGHKVFNNPKPDVFHIVPSGANRANSALLILGPGAVISEETLKEEIRKYDLKPGRLIIDENATIISQDDIKQEEKLDKIGSTKKGVGAATANNIMSRIMGLENHKAKNSKILKPFLGSAYEEFDKLHSVNQKILLEGTQGTMLSLYHGLYPFVTSRDSSVNGCLMEAGLGPHRVRKIIMVARRYPIRVQNPKGGTSGSFQSEEIDIETVFKRANWPEDQRVIQRENEKTTSTNRNRRFAEFSWDLYRKACELNTPTDIALTFADYISFENRKAKRFDNLTPDTLRFIEEMERCSGVPVSMIATNFGFNSVIDKRNWT